MNIAIYYHHELYMTTGGIQKMSNNFANVLISQGHQVFFLIKKRTLPLNYGTAVCEMIFIESDTFDEVSAIRKISDILQSRKIDIVLNQAYSSEFPKCIKESLNIPVVSVLHNTPLHAIYNLHGIDDLYRLRSSKAVIKDFVKIVLFPYLVKKKKRHLKKTYTTLMQYSDRFVLLSEKFRVELAELTLFEDTKVVAIPNFNTHEWYPPISFEDKKDKIVLFVGRFDFKQKRVDRLIKIWEQLYQKYPDWKLRIAGDGPEKANIERYIKRKGIKNVELLGFVQPEEEYKKASIFCMTSTYEGFPMVLIETSMFGCVPMAFSSFASIYDVIDNGVNGVLVDPFDLKQYKEKLERLMNDEPYRIQLQQEALKINLKFKKEDIVQQWISLFEEVIEEHKHKN